LNRESGRAPTRQTASASRRSGLRRDSQRPARFRQHQRRARRRQHI